MDRISALRNVEEVLGEFEAGEIDLATARRRVDGVLRTYATEFEAAERRAYRASGEAPADGVVVVAPDVEAARERVTEYVDGDPTFEVDPL